MMGKRILVAILFVVLLAGLMTSIPATSQTGACANCTWAGRVTKCNDSPAVTEGTAQGNCISVSGIQQGNVYCTVTEFYNCEAATTGCPLESLMTGC